MTQQPGTWNQIEVAGKPVDVSPVATPAGLVVADMLPRLVLLDGNSLEPRHEVPLNSPALRLSASGDRVFVEPYNPDLHPGLEQGNGATFTTEDAWVLVRRGDDVVCVAPLESLDFVPTRGLRTA